MWKVLPAIGHAQAVKLTRYGGMDSRFDRMRLGASMTCRQARRVDMAQSSTDAVSAG